MRVCSLLLLAALPLLASEPPIQLQLLPNVPVQIKSQFEVQIGGVLPGMKIHKQGAQTLEAALILATDPNDLTLHGPPFKLLLTFKDLQVDLKINGHPMPPNSAPWALAQFKQLTGHSLVLVFDNQKMNFEQPPEFGNFPALNQMQLGVLVKEWLAPLFALVGKDLVVGAKFHIPGALDAFASGIDYEVVLIDEDQVEAKFSGSLEKTPSLSKSDAQLEIAGTFEGVIRWDRSNALKSSMQTQYLYTGNLKTAEGAWQSNYNLKHMFTSN